MSSSASSWRRGPTWSAPALAKRSRAAAGPDAAVPAEPRRRPRSRASFGKPLSARFSQASARRSPPPRSRKCIAPKWRPRTAARAVAVKVLRPGVERRFHADLRAFMYRRAPAPKNFPPKRGGCGWSKWSTRLRRSVTVEMDFRLEAAALSEMAENTKDDPDFRVPAVDWDRTRKEVLTLEWIDAHAAVRPRAPAGQGLRSAAARPRRDPDLSAPRPARRLLSRRHASGQSVRRRRRPAGRRRFRHHGPARRRRSACSSRKSCTASSPAIIAAPPRFISRPATCRRTIRSKSFAQAIRAIGEPIHNRTAEDISMAKLLTLLFEVTGLFDMRTRPELLLLQKTMVVVEGVARSLDPKLDMWSHRRTGGARMDDAAISARPASSKAPCRASAKSAALSAACRAS